MTGDRRREDRLEQDGDVRWTVASRRLAGNAALIDVSAGGACIRITASITIDAGAAIELRCQRLPLLPATGRVLWSRPAGGQATICGIELPADPRWTAWLAEHDRALESQDGFAGQPVDVR